MRWAGPGVACGRVRVEGPAHLADAEWREVGNDRGAVPVVVGSGTYLAADIIVRQGWASRPVR